MNVDEKDTIEVQHELLPSEVQGTERKPPSTKSKEAKWFSFKKKSQKKKNGSVIHEIDKSRSSKFTNEKVESENIQNNRLSNPKNSKNEVDELASNSVGVPVGRVTQTKNKMKLRNR